MILALLGKGKKKPNTSSEEKKMKATKFQAATLGLLLCSSVAQCLAQDAQDQLPEGTMVRVRLEQTLSSATAEEGQPVQLTVADNVPLGDRVVIRQGASVVGRVTLAQPKRRMGRAGKLDFSIERVATADGSSIPLRYTSHKTEGGSHAVLTGVLTGGAALAFWPAAPLFLLIKGKDSTLSRGVEFDVFTDQAFTLLHSAPAAAAPTASQQLAAAPDPVAVKVTSDPEGAEIALDGQFVGSTPATLQLTPGIHKVDVKRGKVAWERNLQVLAGSNINVNAILRSN